MAKFNLGNGGEELVGRTSGEMMITILGESTKSKSVDIYANLITTRDPVTMSLDGIFTGDYDYTTAYANNGDIIGYVQTDQKDPEGEISFSFKEDYIYVSDDYIYGQSKNKLIAMMQGGAFKNAKDDTVLTLGTNGTKKTLAKAKKNEMNLPPMYLFYNEGSRVKVPGGLDKDGKPTFQINPAKNKFNSTHKTFCVETRTLSPSAKDTCRMLPLVAKGTAEWAEEDINSFNFTGQKACDVWERSNYFIEGVTEKENTLYNTESIIKEMYVDYILIEEGKTKAPASPEENKLMLVVKDNLDVELYKASGSNWGSPKNITKLVSAGTRFFSKNLIIIDSKSDLTAKLGDDITHTVGQSSSKTYAVNTFVVLDENKKAVNFSLDSHAKPFALVKVFDRETATFRPYVSE